MCAGKLDLLDCVGSQPKFEDAVLDICARIVPRTKIEHLQVVQPQSRSDLARDPRGISAVRDLETAQGGVGRWCNGLRRGHESAVAEQALFRQLRSYILDLIGRRALGILDVNGERG